MSKRTFQCKLSNSIIEYLIDDIKKTAHINFQYINYNQIKPFFLLLRNSIAKIKEEGVEKIRQYIVENDWDTILKEKTSWQIIEHNKTSKYYTIECDINSSLENISIGFGL